ncbi:MAG: universal stress protein [Wenzhouxiangella sp.]
MSGFRKIVVAVDGSSNSLQAARVGARLADGMNAELVLLHCFPMMSNDIAGALGMTAEEITHTRDTAARRAFDLVLNEISARDPAPTEVALIGDVAEEILKYLDNARDLLLVMGRRGQTRMGALLLGSVSDKVLRHTRTPVTVVS